MAKHTQGPWRFDDQGKDSGNVMRGAIVAANGETVAEVFDIDLDPDADAPVTMGKRKEECRQNGLLLAAAPELLAALEAAAKALNAVGAHVPCMAARAAIAKAKGA